MIFNNKCCALADMWHTSYLWENTPSSV